MILYHYTCDDHGLPDILAADRITPYRQPLLPSAPPIIWLTDLGGIRTQRQAESLGLQSSGRSGGPGARCNRIAARFTVQPRYAIPWRDFVAIHHLDPSAVALLEFERTPQHWWVTPQPIRVGQPDYSGGTVA